MAKPVRGVFRWADVGGDIVEPSAGKKDVGFAGGERPPAQYFNANLNLIGEWTSYVNTGRISFGDRSMDLHASAFEAENGCGGQNANGPVTLTQPAEVFCAIQLPIGMRIRSVAFYYGRGGLGSVTCRLKRTNLVNGTETVIASSSADAASSGDQTVTLGAVDYTIAGEAVFLELTCGAATNYVRGARVTFDFPDA